MAKIDDLKQELENLRQEYSKLTGEQAPLFDIKNINEANSAIKAMNRSISDAREEALRLEDGFSGVYGELQGILQEISKSESATNKVTKALRGTASIARELKNEEAGFNKLSLKELKQRQKKQQSLSEEIKLQADLVKNKIEETGAGQKALKTGLLKDKNNKELNKSALKARALAMGITVQELKANAAIIEARDSQFKALKDQDKLLEGRIKKEEQINELMGLGGAAVEAVGGALDKLGMGSLKKALGLDEVSNRMREIAGERLKEIKKGLKKGEEATLGFNDKMKVLQGGIKEAGNQLITNLKDPLAISSFIATQLIDILSELDGQLTKIQQNFGFSSRATNQIRRDLGEIANRSGDSFIQSKKLVESFTELSNTLGFIVDSSGETLVTYTNLTKRFGLANKEAAQLTGLLRLQGKFTEESLDNLIDSTNEFKNQINPALNVKDILKDISGASAAIVVSLGNNPELLAQAAASARGLGLELGQVEKIADSLVNFESSIRAELEAELLTGKQLNLERARFAALTNDLTGLTEELAKNQEVINSFATGNRIEQTAIAKSLGMSREEMAEMVLNQDFLNKLSSDQAELIKSQNKEDFERLTTQQQFNEAVAKAKDLFVNLMDLLSPLINGVNTLAGSMAGVATILSGTLLFVKGAFKPILTIFEAIPKAIKAAKTGVTSFGKTLGGLLGKSALKKLPVIGTIISLGLMLSEFAKGNYAAGLTQLVSGVASLFPGIGTAVAIGADIAYAGIKTGFEEDPLKVGDANLPSSSGPYTITSKSGKKFATDPSDNIQVSPNPGGLSPDMSVIERKLDQLIAVVKQDKIFNLDGKQFAVATAVSRS